VCNPSSVWKKPLKYAILVTTCNRSACAKKVSREKLTKPTPETLPSFAGIDMGASAASFAVYNIYRCATVIADGESSFGASCLGERADELASVKPRALTCTWPRLLSRRFVGRVACQKRKLEAEGGMLFLNGASQMPHVGHILTRIWFKCSVGRLLNFTVTDNWCDLTFAHCSLN